MTLDAGRIGIAGQALGIGQVSSLKKYTDFSPLKDVYAQFTM